MFSFQKASEIADRAATELFEVALDERVSYDGELSKLIRQRIETELNKKGSFEYMIRGSYNQNYSWPFLDATLIEGIRNFLKSKSCLSVMSGKGNLEAQLLARCCDIVATDKIGLKHPNTSPTSGFVVRECDAIKAVRMYDKEVILISWPPYMDSIAAKVLKFALQTGFKYVIYIGEGQDGCCATDEFFKILSDMTTAVTEIEMLRFWGLWDFCTVYKSKLEKTSDVKFRSRLLNKKIRSFIFHNSSLKNKILKKLVKKYFNVQLGKKHINFLKSVGE